MMSFEVGDIIVVDYPHVETSELKRRPAVVISAKPLGPNGLVLWAMMITSAANKSWPGDLKIKDHRAYGLPIPSVIRTEKVAVIEASEASLLGRMSDEMLSEVQGLVAGHLGLMV